MFRGMSFGKLNKSSITCAREGTRLRGIRNPSDIYYDRQLEIASPVRIDQPIEFRVRRLANPYHGWELMVQQQQMSTQRVARAVREKQG